MVEARHIRVRSRSFKRSDPGVVSRRRRSGSQGTEVGIAFTGLVICLVSLALLITARQAEVARVGYEIVALKKELAALEAEYQRLDVEVARLQSFERIEAAALKLGMKRPAEVRLVYSEQPLYERPVAQVSPQKPGLRQLLAQVGATFARIASGVMGAEARTLK